MTRLDLESKIWVAINALQRAKRKVQKQDPLSLCIEETKKIATDLLTSIGDLNDHEDHHKG